MVCLVTTFITESERKTVLPIVTFSKSFVMQLTQNRIFSSYKRVVAIKEVLLLWFYERILTNKAILPN